MAELLSRDTDTGRATYAVKAGSLTRFNRVHRGLIVLSSPIGGNRYAVTVRSAY